MAENKKSFVMYCDLIDNIDHLTIEEKGLLFNHLLEYVNDRNPVLKDRVVLSAWKPIERQLKRDLIKFEEVKVKRSNAGKRSAELRALKKDKKDASNSTSVESVQQSSTNPTVSVNDNENVNDTVISINIDKENEYTQNYTEQFFLGRWKKARMVYDNKPTHISKLLPFESVNFEAIKKTYTGNQIDMAIQGLFAQETFGSIRLRPSHFLELEHFEKYLTCFDTGEKLFETKKFIKQKDRI